MFTAIVVTRTIFEVLLGLGWLKSLPMLRLIKNTKIDFVGKRMIWFAISLVLTFASLTAFFMKGKTAYGIDFSGGQLQEYSFKTPVQIDRLRAVLKELGFGDATIQYFKDNPRAVLIKTSSAKSDIITNKLKEKFPDQDIQVLRIEKVGPVAGKHLADKAINCLIWSFVGITIYVAFRFRNFSFGLAGVIAIVHDVIVSLGFLLFTGREIDLLSITAFLTIAGYSINDTIVVYDRIRENMRLLRKATLGELMNISINQTLSRTILTSGVTLLVVIAIFLFGGEVLNGFSFALIVGFIVGTYSSIYVASSLVLAWSRRAAK
jgi:preprotein translocase SecF subunit